jgi:DNA-binding transcriptional ArsR family regulator
MNAPGSPSKTPVVSFDGLVTAIGEKTRWRILNAIFDEPLPTGEIARRIGIQKANASKHMGQLVRAGIVIRGYGNVYRIPADFVVPGERAIDLGPVVLRLDRQGK